jgi:hypothetical protein
MQKAAAHAEGAQAREGRPLRLEELDHEAHPARDAPAARAAAVIVAQFLLVEVQRATEALADRQLRRERAGVDGQHEARPARAEIEGREVLDRLLGRQRGHPVTVCHGRSLRKVGRARPIGPKARDVAS